MSFCFHPQWDVQQFFKCKKKQVIKQFSFSEIYTVFVYTVKKETICEVYSKKKVAVAKTLA